MGMSLLPPFKVNYHLVNLFCSLFVSEKSSEWKDLCVNTLSRVFHTDNIFLTSSGRNGLNLILKTLPQKKVFVPAFTCPVVIEAIQLAGKEIVYVPTNPVSFNSNDFQGVDNDSIVLATHQYGLPCDIEAISNLCKEKSAVLIEDCAAAFGTTIGDKLVGTFGDYAIFSFNSSKLLTVPSMGGFVMAKEPDKLQQIKKLAKYDEGVLKFKIKHILRGVIFCLSKNKYLYKLIYHLYIKRGLHLNNPRKESYDGVAEETYFHPFYEWQARILYHQLLKLPKIVGRNRKSFEFYEKNIQNDGIIKPMYNASVVCSRYTIRVKDRESFYNKCLANGVDMDFSFSGLYCPDSFGTELQMASEILNVPLYYEIKDRDLRYIVDTLNSIK